MATLSFAYNHARDPMNPADLGNKIAVALALTTLPTVDINPTLIVVTHASITSANTAAIQTVINAYVLDPTWAGGVAAAMQAKAVAAIPTNVTYLAVAVPSTAQNTAQLNALTKAVNALIRLVAQQLDSTAGT